MRPVWPPKQGPDPEEQAAERREQDRRLERVLPHNDFDNAGNGPFVPGAGQDSARRAVPTMGGGLISLGCIERATASS